MMMTISSLVKYS